MLNKLQLNNLIISNKKKIQQGRIQTINKLVQKLRKLKSLLEKRPENEKNKERYRKAAETMGQIKKLKRVELVKRILVLEKSPTAVVTNGRATPEEVAIAMLAMNRILQDLVKHFKEQLQLNDDADADPTWKEAILETSKRRAKIIRTEEKRRKRQEVKDQRVIARKRAEWLQDNNNTAEDAASSSVADITSQTGVWKVEDIDDIDDIDDGQPANKSTKKLPHTKDKKTKKTPAKQQVRLAASEKPKAAPKLTQAEEKTEIALQPQTDVETSATEEKLEAPRQQPARKDAIKPKQLPAADEVELPLKRLKAEPRLKPARKDDCKAEELPAADEETHVVDPFFITDTGDNYLSTAVVARNNQEEDEAAENPFGNSRRERRAQNPSRNWKANARDAPPKRHWERNETRQSQSQPQPQPQTPSENLHPSWAAKQKLKPVISGFQGKKITFTEDGDGVKPKALQQHNTNRSSGAKKESSAPDPSAAANLHPSWAAKQKLKPTITAFQGKKITFDAD